MLATRRKGAGRSTALADALSFERTTLVRPNRGESLDFNRRYAQEAEYLGAVNSVRAAAVLPPSTSHCSNRVSLFEPYLIVRTANDGHRSSRAMRHFVASPVAPRRSSSARYASTERPSVRPNRP